MRRWWSVVGAAAMMMAIAIPANAAESVRVRAEVTTGTGAVGQAKLDPSNAGEWRYTADVTGPVHEAWVQLYLVDRHGGCTGEQLGNHRLSGETDKASWKKRSVAPGSYEGSFDSASDSEHCAQVVVHGQRGATVVVDFVAPEGEPISLLDQLLPSSG